MANEPNADDVATTSEKQIAQMFVALAKAEQDKDNLQEQLTDLTFNSLCMSIQFVRLLGMVPPETVIMIRDGVRVLATDAAEEVQSALDSVEPQTVIDQLRAGGLDPDYKAPSTKSPTHNAEGKRIDGYGDPSKGEYNAFLADDGSDIPCD